MNINLDSAKDTLCKNILIYGYCKFENKGCAFSHSPATTSKSPVNQSSEVNSKEPKIESKKKFNFNTPSFQPSAPVNNLANKFSSLSPKLNDIPTFVPNSDSNNGLNGPNLIINGSNGPTAPITTPTGNSNNSARKFNTSANVFTPSSYETSPVITPANPYVNTTSNGNQQDMYYQPMTTNFPLNYHLYAPYPPPRLSIPLPPHQTNSGDMFIPNDLRETLLKRNEATLMTMGARTGLPDNVGVYHSLMPIDLETKSLTFGVNTALYKVFSNIDGNAYVLRKIDHEDLIKIDNKLPFKTIEKWKQIDNSNIVKLKDCFTTIAFGGIKSQLCVIFDYYPNANTLQEHHINRKLGSKLEPITEEVLWCYIIQITNALMSIHNYNLSANSSLNLRNVIVVGKNRVKLSSCGIGDILNFENEEIDIITLQQEDLKNFGKVMLELAQLMSPTTNNYSNEEAGIQSLRGIVSDELISFIHELIINYKYANLEKLNKIYLGKRLIKMINDLQKSHDYVENQLSNEIENARLFRLMAKINFIIDHPLFNWNENERVYLIKLFNDYIFHQYDNNNKPVIDLSRVLVKLNKLDCGIDEKFMLITRDEKLSILLSYKELRDIIDSTFRELTK